MEMGDPSSKSLTTSMFLSCKRRYERYGDNFETFFPESPPSNPVLSEPLNFHRESKYWSLMKDQKNAATSENLTDDQKTGDKIPFSMVFSSEGKNTAEFFIGSNQNQQIEPSANLNGSPSDTESVRTGKVYTEIMENTNVQSFSRNTSVPSSLHSFNKPHRKENGNSDIDISLKSQKNKTSDMDKSERYEKLREIAFSDLSEGENSPKLLKKNKSFAGFSQMNQVQVHTNDGKSVILSDESPSKIVDEINTGTPKQEKTLPAAGNFPMKEHIITSSKPPKTSLSSRLINWSTATKVNVSSKEMNVWAPVGS